MIRMIPRFRSGSLPGPFPKPGFLTDRDYSLNHRRMVTVARLEAASNSFRI